MTKRRIERDLEEVREEVLEDLSPEDRLQLYLEAAAKEKDGWIESLLETCPRRRYRTTDLEFSERRQLASTLRLNTLYKLHTALLELQMLRQRQELTWINTDGDDDLTESERERADERAEELRFQYSELYTLYHSYRQFSEEVLGVDLETWLGSHPNGQHVLEVITKELDNSIQQELVEEDLNPSDAEPEDDEWVTIDEIADLRYEEYISMWSDVIEERTP
ncbi:hypothetical protein QA600_21110 [Natronococcus sp. A-GB1]|uniref:hypothetical protein n=1 Tax=Natronococcus sp. A-GB1 TaxID=3037648 RepID=UPI00241E702B|nr:hypothetical protein [Natronococcus sp. A-GB1]MDG5761826.1 hypothetical protein [Natronococcus sp. A-GB1]